MERSVGHEIKCLSNLIRREVDCHSDASPATVMQGLFIGYLYRNRRTDCFQKDLEAEFRIRRSTATGILQLMERNELIRREPVNYDARLKRLELTEKGTACFCQMQETFHCVEDKTTAGLTAEELSTFFALVDKMKKNLEPFQEENNP